MINKELLVEVKNRQKTFLKNLGTRACLLSSGYEKVRNSDVNHSFRQLSDFTYLTAFPEPDSIAFFDPEHESENYILFVRESDRFMELWNGFRYGVEGTLETFQADAVYSIKDLETILTDRLSKREVAFFVEGEHPLEERLRKITTLTDGEEQSRIRFDLNYQRMIKTPWELSQIRLANEISIEAHHRLMQATPKSSFEYELQAEFDYYCTKSGFPSQAYGGIFASGANACCLHYTANNQSVKFGDLVLVDAGTEVNSYASDITRTFPANGTFTDEQALFYDLTLEAMNKTIEFCEPGKDLNQMHDFCTEILAEGLIDIGLLKGSVEENIESKAIKKYFPHGTGHFLGLDVHDVRGRETVPFEEGMVFTVEPGIYIQDYDDNAPDNFKGIGIRIEDNIAITKDGHENLTPNCVKEPKDVEAMVQSGLNK